MTRVAVLAAAVALVVIGLSCWRYEAAVSAPERPCHPVAACTAP